MKKEREDRPEPESRQNRAAENVTRPDKAGDEAAPPNEDANEGENEGASEAAAEAVGPEDDEVNQLQEALAQSREELERHREAMLRMQAEMENQRKRMAREVEKSRRFALERMMKDLLQVRDSLERALEVDDGTATVEKLKEGKALTLKMLSKVMEDHGLEVVDPMGEPFNPEFHEAMTTAPSDEVDENTVTDVLQKGFKLHDRLIRPAMVVVSKKPE